MKKDRRFRIGVILIAISLCGSFVLLTQLAIQLDILPDSEERKATDLAREESQLPTRFLLSTNTLQVTETTTSLDTSVPTSTITDTFQPPNTAMPTSTVTETPLPTDTPVPITYFAIATANIRDCPRLDCTLLGSLTQGQPITVSGSEVGEQWNGSDTWLMVTFSGQMAYVHSTLVTRTPPPTSAPVFATSQPLQPTQPPASGFTCNCSKTCGAMANCEEAYFQLNQCGCSSRDNDQDGVPCESICPGG